MFDDFNICPYTGLRSFTEEESIYFKGRDEHIQQATAQLEKNKFLMLTGASGDGKSSIVYAGIIPNARAGFLKATYSNWHIADFRPERTPFQNLCKKIAKSLKIENADTVESELQHGFSALIDLYKSSPLYIDITTVEYKNASEEERKKMMHSSANLMILVDQFEEFFTNPENYVNGVPSSKATLTMNLLLETAKLAQEQGIPIYIVFTMRSDFIGQCAAFRELPEYIGYSQFFVPRLNRKLLQEVIEEPCTLSGNRITRRLTERIIHDMTDGADQLPILQHALNQIWKAADNGKEEMDLIHYTMVGGLDPNELPADEQARFNAWFESLPSNIQNCFHERSLHNVLDTHANKIYESAADYLKEKTGKSISSEIAHAIIKVTFTSLTKIDQSREVRNRMTLEEIRDILNNPEADLDTISEIINLFREPGNTFIRPFILDDPNTHQLAADSVLDITHESLIRNWNKLGSWTKEEYDKFVVFKDFKQQVDRWIEHGKSSGFLLPIGSLTFFEKWYSEAKINKFWVNRYNEQVTDTPKNIEESTHIVDDSRDFLARSGRKHMITRAVVRFGPRKIGAVVALLLFLGLSSFFYYDYRKRTSNYVLNQVDDDAFVLLNGDKAPYNIKATYLINSERLEKGRFEEIVNSLDSDQNKLNITIAAAEYLTTNDRHGSIKLQKESILYAESIAKNLYSSNPPKQSSQADALRELLDLAEICEYYTYLNNEDEIDKTLLNITSIISRLILHLIEHPFAEMDMQKFIEGVEMSLNHKQFSAGELNSLISILNNPESAIQANLDKNKIVGVGRGSETITYGGKYQLLADIHATLGNVDSCLEAIDMILADQARYHEYVNDGNSVAGYFIHYDHWQALDDYVAGYATRIGYKPFEIYRQIASRSGIVTQSVYERNQYSTFGWINLTYNPILDYMDDESFDQLYKSYYNSITKTTSSDDEREYYLAIYFKQKGLYTAKRFADKQTPRLEWIEGVEADFEQAVSWYNMVSSTYNNQLITGFFHIPIELPRRQLFTYPDYVEEVASHAPRTRYANYLSPEFLRYLIENDLMEKAYGSGSELEQVTTWIREYKNAKYVYAWNYQPNDLKVNILQNIDSAVLNHKNSDFANKSLLMLLLANESFRNSDTGLGIEYAERINYLTLPDLFNEEWIGPHVKTFNLIGEIYGYLAINNQVQLVQEIYNSFSNIRNQASLLDHAASVLYIEGLDSLANIYYDSAEKIITSRIEIGGQNRKLHAYATSLRGNKGDFKLSSQLIRNLGGFRRNSALTMNLRATAYRGYYFDAYSSIPKFSSSEERLNIANQIVSSQIYFEEDSLWKEYDYKMEYINTVLWYFN